MLARVCLLVCVCACVLTYMRLRCVLGCMGLRCVLACVCLYVCALAECVCAVFLNMCACVCVIRQQCLHFLAWILYLYLNWVLCFFVLGT